jgi:putative MFS transporter
MGWASGMSRIAGAIAPVLGGLLLPVSLLGALGLYGLSFALGGLVVLGMGSETRDLPLPDMAVEKNEPRPA